MSKYSGQVLYTFLLSIPGVVLSAGVASSVQTNWEFLTISYQSDQLRSAHTTGLVPATSRGDKSHRVN